MYTLRTVAALASLICFAVTVTTQGFGVLAVIGGIAVTCWVLVLALTPRRR